MKIAEHFQVAQDIAAALFSLLKSKRIGKEVTCCISLFTTATWGLENACIPLKDE